jgi:hypothetical protein
MFAANAPGGLCATFGVPVYNCPNGKPIGMLASIYIPIIRGEQHQGYTFMFFTSDTYNPHPLMPYDLKSLRQCG